MIEFLMALCLMTPDANLSQRCTPPIVFAPRCEMKGLAPLLPDSAPAISRLPELPEFASSHGEVEVVRPDTTRSRPKKHRIMGGDHLVVSLARSQQSLTSAPSRWSEDLVSVRLNASGMAAGKAPAPTKENTLRRTVIAFEGGRASRFGQTQEFGGFDYYRTIVARTYANLRIRLAPRAVIIPEFDALFELTGGTKTGWEGTVGYRLMRYQKSSVNVFSAAGARYYGLWYFRGRMSLIPVSGSMGTSVVVAVRRYFREGEELVEVVISNGREVVTGSSDVVIDVRQSISGVARVQYFLTESIGVNVGVDYTGDANLSRWGFVVGMLAKM